MRENKEITTIFDPRRTGGANISSSGGVRGGRPTPPSVVIVTAPPQENVAPLGEPTEVEGLMANGPSLAAPSNQNCPQVLAPPTQSSSSMHHQPSGAGGSSMAPSGTCNSHPADHNQSQPTCPTLTNNRRASALQSLQNFKKSCCSRSARKMYCGVCVTVCVTASWVGATHSIKYLYHLGPASAEPMEVSNKAVEVLDSQTTSSYALPSSSDGVISLGPSLAPGASSTRLVPATKVSPLYDAPFFTTWFCTNWTILFFPIYAIGHYLASPCSSKTSGSDIQGDAEINPGQSKRSCCSSYSSCCSCLRRSEEGREEDNSGARASSSSSSSSSDEEGNTRGSSSSERRGTEQRGEEETAFPGGEMSSSPRRRPQTPTQCCFCMCRSKKEVQHHHHHHHHKNSKQHCDLLANTMQRFRDKGFTPARFLTRCSLFCLLWVAYNYMYVHSLRILFSTDAMALYATHACCVYLLSWVLLHHQFVGVRIVAVITCDTGIALLAYMDGITGSPTLGGVVLAACAAAGSAVYKVLFKKVMGEVSMGQIALFFSLVGLLNALLLWPLLLALYLLGAETFLWNELPWLELLLTGALSLLANLFSNFSVAVTYDLFITLGFITAVPVSAALDVVLYGAHFAGMKLAGIVLISVGFFLVMFPDNWPDYITRLLRNIIMLSHSARWSRRQRHGGTVGQRRDVVDYRTGYIRSHLRSPSGRVR